MTTTSDVQQRDDQEGGRLAAVGETIRDGAETARTKAGDAYRAAREKTSAAYGSVRETASDLATSTRERASSAAQAARDGAASARRTTADGIDANPVVALVGGLALGAVAAALIPVTRRERLALGDVSRRVNERARAAARAATDAGREKIGELGIADSAKQTLGDIASKAGEAARSSASAAAQSVKSAQ